MPAGDRERVRYALDRQAVDRLAESLEVLKTNGEYLARSFYDALFLKYPALRSMFPADMNAQEASLIKTLVAVVELLRDVNASENMITQLGKRHAGYGARPEHYPIVCSMLLEAMAAHFGSRWNESLKTEWTQALELIARRMIQAQTTR